MITVIQVILAILIAWAAKPGFVSHFVINPYTFKDVPTFIAANEAAATSASLPAGASAGDLAIVFAVSAVSNTGIATGYTGFSNTLAGGPTSWGYKILTSSDISGGTTGTWTNSQRTTVAIYRLSMFTSYTGVTGASSGTPTASAFTSGTTIVAWVWGNGQTIKSNTISGYTTRSSTFGAGGNDIWLGDSPSPAPGGGTGASSLWRSYSVSIVSHSNASPISGQINSEDENYFYATFTTIGAGTLTLVTNCVADRLTVAGGGGGGNGPNAGGGGAGGIVYDTGVVLNANQSVSVGDGGAGAPSSTTATAGTAGSNTTAGSATATGGGGGGQGSVATATTGGSGGGGGTSSAGAAGTAGQGNSGGTAGVQSSISKGGGGGGAGAAGVNGASGGTGGDGTQYAGFAPWIGAQDSWFGGGGGGGAKSLSGTAPAGGHGGGGHGNAGTSGGGTVGTTSTGGGGGGGADNGGTTHAAGFKGGSGIVVYRVPK